MLVKATNILIKNISSFYIKLFCVLLGITTRLIYCIQYPVQPRDTYEYIETIMKWEQNGAISGTIERFPLSLWFLKIPYHYFKYDLIKGGVIVNMCLGVFLIIVAMNSIAKIYPEKRVLFITGLLIATHPFLIKLSCSFLRENTYLLFCFISFSYIFDYYFRKPFLEKAIKAGLFASIAFLCRLEGLELLPIFLSIVLIASLTKHVVISKALLHGVVFLFVFVSTTIIISYYLGVNYSHFLSIVQKSTNAFTN